MVTPAAVRVRRAIASAAVVFAATATVIIGALVIWPS
jgi:hypothetical protein